MTFDSYSLPPMLLVLWFVNSLWPLALSGLAGIWLRKSLRRPIAYFVLGAATCYGVEYFTHHLLGVVERLVDVFPPDDPLESWLWRESLGKLLLELLIAVSLLAWLYRAFEKRKYNPT